MLPLILTLLISATRYSEPFSVEDNFRTFSDVEQLCKSYPSENNVKNLLIGHKNHVYSDVTTKVNVTCVESTRFFLDSGVLEAKIFVEDISQDDFILVVVHSHDEVVVIRKVFSASDLTTKDGWQTLSMDFDVENSYGYVALNALTSKRSAIFTHKMSFTYERGDSSIPIYEAKNTISDYIKTSALETTDTTTKEDTIDRDSNVFSKTENELLFAMEFTADTVVPKEVEVENDSFWIPLTITVFAIAGTVAVFFISIALYKKWSTSRESSTVVYQDNDIQPQTVTIRNSEINEENGTTL